MASAGAFNAIAMRYREAMYVTHSSGSRMSRCHGPLPLLKCRNCPGVWVVLVLLLLWWWCIAVRCCSDGLEVTDEDGNRYGKSPAAGVVGLTQVALTRVALPIPGKCAWMSTVCSNQLSLTWHVQPPCVLGPLCSVTASADGHVGLGQEQLYREARVAVQGSKAVGGAGYVSRVLLGVYSCLQL